MKPQIRTSPALCPTLCGVVFPAAAAAHPCLRCPGVSQNVLLIAHGMAVQAGTGPGSQAQLEEWQTARQGREGSLGRICVQSAVLHPLAGTLKMPNTIPSGHHGDQRTFGVCNSFLEILSSYCIRKRKNQCLSREASPNPSGREGSFRSCFCLIPFLLSAMVWDAVALLLGHVLAHKSTSYHSDPGAGAAMCRN